MKNLILSIALLIVVQISTSAQKIDNIIQSKYSNYLEAESIHAVALVKKDGRTSSFSIGGPDNLNTWNEHSVFNIGSATKGMTSILILQEVQNNRMKLSDKISDYLPELPNVDGNLTIEQLLRHESGLGEIIGANYLDLAFGNAELGSRSDIIQEIPPSTGNFDFNYTNTNYVLLGHILESASEKPYYELLQERIFDVCGMSESHPFLYSEMANLSPPRHDGKDVSDSVNFELYDTYAYSAGSVASTLSDMLKYYEALYSSDLLLDRKHFETMISSNTDTSETARYGLGIITVEHDEFTFYAHGGDNIGYSFRNYYDPVSKNCVLLYGNEIMFTFNYEIQRDLLKHIKDQEIILAQVLDPRSVGDLRGDFIAADLDFEFSLFVEDGLPYIDALGSPKGLLVNGDTLFNDLLEVKITLDSLRTGSVSFSFNGQECRAYRPAYLPSKYQEKESQDLSEFSPYHGLFAIKEIGVEMELKGDEDQVFLVAQGTELKLQRSDENTLTYAVMGINLNFDFNDTTAFTFIQGGQEFTATRVN